MPRVGDAFPSNYLKASDLGGKNVTVVVDHVAMEAVGRDKEVKPVIYFQGKDKGLVCNKTNANKITSIAGTDEMDDWPGTKVVLFATMVEFGGEEVEGIRVRKPGPAVNKPVEKQKPEPDREPGADEDEEVGF